MAEGAKTDLDEVSAGSTRSVVKACSFRCVIFSRHQRSNATVTLAKNNSVTRFPPVERGKFTHFVSPAGCGSTVPESGG